jgi:hypothetical protein
MASARAHRIAEGYPLVAAHQLLCNAAQRRNHGGANEPARAYWHNGLIQRFGQGITPRAKQCAKTGTRPLGLTWMAAWPGACRAKRHGMGGQRFFLLLPAQGKILPLP